MKFTLGEIARLIGGELVGDPDVVITGVSGIKEAKSGDITFLANQKYDSLLLNTKASAVITTKDASNLSVPSVKTNNPSLAFTKIIKLFLPHSGSHPQGIHPAAIISKEARIGKNVSIGAGVIIEKGASIGENSIIYGGCYIGNGVVVGEDCLFYPHVSITERNEIGSRVVIHSGTVIGSDGFGFTDIGGVQEKIPQIGIVLIEDDVEIGSNVSIDRARFDKTIISKGTKIDNLVHIAHNVVIGQNCLILAQVGISGSTTLGEKVILAGQVGIVGHINVGDEAIAAAQAGVTKSVPAKTMVSGYPARVHSQARRVNACVQKLPDLYKKIKELETKIEKLEKKKVPCNKKQQDTLNGEKT
ncbi:MAG: UDP-3-O-(3-hydroxymyristoyl)glucosamine N-acyltransferase [Candidatus Omnitrophica bacterium]|nr:UDP-3-O-(3-hydroxymyristoyl)glucosamine N-acyltransferase [Candidatus Omnitrophota bacterium]